MIENRNYQEKNESAQERSFFILPDVFKRLDAKVKTDGKPLSVLLQEKIHEETSKFNQLDEKTRIEYMLGLQTSLREIRKDYRRRIWDMQYAANKTNIGLSVDLELELRNLANESNTDPNEIANMLLVELANES